MADNETPLEVTRADLAAAVAEGILTAEQGERFHAFLLRTRQKEAILEERVAFISGFQDVFLTLGAGLVLVAAAVFGSAFASLPLAWIFAEILNRRAGTRLSMIAMALAFTASAVFLVEGLAHHGEWSDGFVPAAGALAASSLFAARFRTPFTALLIAGSLFVAVIEGLRLRFGLDGAVWVTAEVALGGVLCFALAMAFDLSDRLRTTPRADAAFWLHMAAAPALAHGVLGLLLLSASGYRDWGLIRLIESGLGERPLFAVAVIAVVLVMAAVALVIDRRSLMVSTLLYFVGAVSVLIGKTGFATHSDTLPLALLFVGFVVFFIGLGWKRARGALLRQLPPALTARLAPQ